AEHLRETTFILLPTRTSIHFTAARTFHLSPGIASTTSITLTLVAVAGTRDQSSDPALAGPAAPIDSSTPSATAGTPQAFTRSPRIRPLSVRGERSTQAHPSPRQQPPQPR